MIDPSHLETAIRGIAVGGFAAAGLALAATPRPTPTRWLGAAFFACAIGHVIAGSSFTLRPYDPIWATSVTATGLFWMFTLDLLEDAPQPPAWRLAAPAIAFCFWLAAQVAPRSVCYWIWGAYNAFSVLMVLHVLFVAWRGWRGDLVSQRRRLRPLLAASAGGYVLLVAAKDMGWLSPPVDTLGLAQAIALSVLALGTTLVLLKAETQLLAPPSLANAVPAAGLAPLPLGPADRLVLVRLDRAMTENEVWRDESLSIGTLTALVGAPEHRLRKLINGALGHRNFADYVNSRRIEAAKVALSDPELALKSVSAIAYDLGFASLGPFNRAFRAATGATPTAWRQEACAGAPPRLRLVETDEAASNSNKLA